MSETAPGPGPAPYAPAETSGNLRSYAMACYVLFLIACVNGLTAIAGVVLAYIKRADARGTIWQSHFDNMIAVFWVMFAVAVLWIVSWPVSFGILWARDFVWPWVSVIGVPLLLWMIAFPLILIWYFYRLIRGLVHAGDDKPY